MESVGKPTDPASPWACEKAGLFFLAGSPITGEPPVCNRCPAPTHASGHVPFQACLSLMNRVRGQLLMPNGLILTRQHAVLMNC